MAHESLRIIRDEHAALAAMLQSLVMLVKRGPEQDADNYFGVLRAMLLYIDEFPERMHHPKESNLLFPHVARYAPHTLDVIARLERDHLHGESAVRDLLHLLVGWELMGETRRQAFTDACLKHVDFYLEHMRLEENVVLPEAEKGLTEAEWAEIDAAFEANRDPLTGKYPAEPIYSQLFTRIVMKAPAPIGLGGQ